MRGDDVPWLTLLGLAPLVGGLVLALLPRGRDLLAKQVALGFATLTLVVAVAIAAQYDLDGAGYQLSEQVDWIGAFGVHYALGVNGLGLTLVLMTAILTPVVVLASWNDGDTGRWSSASFFAWMLVLEGLALGAFMATDVFLFYVLFEATLIPLYFLIGGYGGRDRQGAALKFLVYNLLGGLVMLAAVVGLYVVSSRAGSPSYLLSDLMDVEMGTWTERLLFIGFMVAFAIKAPLWPLHTWLPGAAKAATPGSSVLMVSVLDKIGTFGMLRFCLGLFPEASQWASPVVITLAVISIIYGALLAIGEDDIRRLIAYTSVSHFGFIILGIFAFTTQSTTGAALYMFNHGLSTAALFLVTGFLIARRGSASIADYGGVQKVAPVLAGILLLAGLSSLSLPGLSPFVSEFLVLAGTFTRSTVAAVFATLGIVLAALYILLMYQRTMTGPLREDNAHVTDLHGREIASLAPMVVLIIGLGLFPQPLLNVIQPSVDATLQHVGVTDPAPVATEAEEGSR
ncbi:NADH-quinone oxidoreductase subunit M [Solicola sp. PLA-1-18]|uniref:NADH-quinone oxidoreductase subunit M n=1 Tax=Solicola sp. PLA-1-18 TaxID=3380532 RepID=UPI003B7EA6CF